MPFVCELFLEVEVVFNNAVVDHHHGAVAVSVRVRVFFGRGPVCRPARVADAVRAVKRVQANNFLEVSELPFRAADVELGITNHR